MALMSTNELGRSGLIDLKARVLNRLRRGLRGLREARLRRRSLASLKRLEPWQLDDVGYTRAEIDWALELPLYIDAAHAVSLRASRRRSDESAARQREASGRGARYRARHRTGPT